MTEETTDAPVELPTEESLNLTIGDIAGIVSIIDICSKRGAFEGSELETVGALRSRVAAFVEQARPPVPVEEAEAEAEADPDPEGREQPEDEA